MPGYTADLKRLLMDAGCEFFRNGKGDHEIWQCPNGSKVTVDGNIKSRHTANEVLKQAGLTKAF